MLTEIYIEAYWLMKNWLIRFGEPGIRGRLMI